MANFFKLNNNEAIKPASVLNLSSYPLKENEISLLSKGLKFIPKPPKINNTEIKKAFAEFSRKVKIQYLFGKKKCNYGNDDDDEKTRIFYKKSNWTPEDSRIFPDLIEDLKDLKKELDDIRPSQVGKNISKQEMHAIKSLRNNPNIILKPADKGSSIVVMNKADYLKEGYRQLNNPQHYRKINAPIHPSVKEKINSSLQAIHKKRLIDKKQLEYLSVPKIPRDRKFYLLPKVNKPKDKWSQEGTIPPGRPIVSDCDSDTYRISEYIDHFLAPLAKTHPSYVKDTPDLLTKLAKQKDIPPGSLLITLDVDSLYTNIDNKNGLTAVRKQFQNNPDPKRPDAELLDLLKISLENNDFTFNNEWFLQTHGTAMGKRFAPHYANIFLADWEAKALKKCPKKPLCYFRYLDDILLIWPHSRTEFDTFFQILNNHHPSIKLKSTISNHSIDFLDITIFKGNSFNTTGTLDTKMYFKPTDTHELLHKASYHPKHTFAGIIKSQILRFHRNCSNIHNFDNACTTLFSALKQRGYSPRFLRTLKMETLKSLKSTGKSSKCNDPRCKTCLQITENDHIISTHNNKLVPLKENLNCKSENVIYAIKCSNCQSMYVGETTQKLHERINQHRSTIRTEQNCPVAHHFTKICPNINFLTVTPLEKVPITTDELGLIPTKSLLTILQREQFWIKKLNSMQPFGMNKRREIPPPITFCVKYMDSIPTFRKIVKTFYDKLVMDYFGIYSRHQFILSLKRNKNLKDLLIRA